MPNGSGPIRPDQVLSSAGPSISASLPRIGSPTAGMLPQGQAISLIFNIGGAPITVLGGVFSDGLPIGGPLTQIFRGGSAPTPPTLFISTLTSSGPIGTFLIGSEAAPIGVATFGGGALPIGIPPLAGQEAAVIQPRTALVGAAPALAGLASPPVLVFGPATTSAGAPPVGGRGGIGSGGAPIGGT